MGSNDALMRCMNDGMPRNHRHNNGPIFFLSYKLVLVSLVVCVAHVALVSAAELRGQQEDESWNLVNTGGHEGLDRWEWSCSPSPSSSLPTLTYCGSSSFSGRFVGPSKSLRQGYEMLGRLICGQWGEVNNVRPITFTLFDDQSSGEVAEKAMDECHQVNSSLLLAPYSSTLSLKIAPKADGKSCVI